MELSIIIVNYNVQYFLENCLLSVFQSLRGIEAEVFVVDNNSIDGSLKMLEKKFPQVNVIVNTSNKGFSKANNQAIAQAKGEYILLLNPDTVVKEDTFRICMDFFKANPHAGGLGVKMFDGKGLFLPESKRGLPTPEVAFYKIFGLSQLFPKSKKFGQYHLGHLSKDQNHEIDVLSGAFMMIRKKVLDKIGWLDESFFMYGEDIDISYRITKAGYKNYYLSDTSIIHYKGESTKKSSINYVFVFYRAMAIFAKKHFSNKNARLFSALINIAIYARAAIAIATRMAKSILLPVIDFALLFIGVFTFKSFYEENIKFVSGGAYPEEVEIYGIPIISFIYLLQLWISGAYYIPTKFKNIVKGVFSGSLTLLIVYALLDEGYRFSRAIILFTVLLAIIAIPFVRYLLHLSGLRKFAKTKAPRIAIVGEKDEVVRIHSFLDHTLIEPEKIIHINTGNEISDENSEFEGKLNQLADLVEIYQIDEVVFCAKNLSSKIIIEEMTLLSKYNIEFKIAPPESLYIIGSNSIENSGEYYLIETDVYIKPVNQRNKRLLDILLSVLFLLLSPLFILFSNFKSTYYKQIFQVLRGKISFVGFYKISDKMDKSLRIKQGILNPTDNLEKNKIEDHKLIERLNLEYGKEYNWSNDLKLIFYNLSKIGRPITH